MCECVSRWACNVDMCHVHTSANVPVLCARVSLVGRSFVSLNLSVSIPVCGYLYMSDVYLLHRRKSPTDPYLDPSCRSP